MYIVEKKGGLYSLPAKELEAANLRSFGSALAEKVLKVLAEGPAYPKEIAQKLNVHEQKIYYHIKNFERSGVVKVTKKETMQGATAKYYELVEPAFVVRFKELEATSKLSENNESEFLSPFVEHGKFNATIVVGSPESHGAEKARSRDGYYGIDVALFFGTFLTYAPRATVKLDTEMRQEDLRQNLILLGGPVVNKITEKINLKMPIRFDISTKTIFSTITKKRYAADETGIVVKFANPYAKDKRILVLAGKRYSGTRAATIALLGHSAEIAKGNKKDKSAVAKVVEGLDLNSDGIIDAVEFKE